LKYSGVDLSPAIFERQVLLSDDTE
jgi:hypothetical protein